MPVVWLDFLQCLIMNAGVKYEAEKRGSWLDCREVISADRETDPSPAAPPATSPEGRPWRASRSAACRRRSQRRSTRNRKATPATLPTTPPTILFVVGLGPDDGGGGLVAVELGPVAVAAVPKPPAVG